MYNRITVTVNKDNQVLSVSVEYTNDKGRQSRTTMCIRSRSDNRVIGDIQNRKDLHELLAIVKVELLTHGDKYHVMQQPQENGIVSFIAYNHTYAFLPSFMVDFLDGDPTISREP